MRPATPPICSRGCARSYPGANVHVHHRRRFAREFGVGSLRRSAGSLERFVIAPRPGVRADALGRVLAAVPGRSARARRVAEPAGGSRIGDARFARCCRKAAAFATSCPNRFGNTSSRNSSTASAMRSGLARAGSPSRSGRRAPRRRTPDDAAVCSAYRDGRSHVEVVADGRVTRRTRRRAGPRQPPRRVSDATRFRLRRHRSRRSQHRFHRRVSDRARRPRGRQGRVRVLSARRRDPLDASRPARAARRRLRAARRPHVSIAPMDDRRVTRMVLASGSPRRLNCCARSGSTSTSGRAATGSRRSRAVSPERLATLHAREKLASALRARRKRRRGLPVIAADTVVDARRASRSGSLRDAGDAARMLRLLSGREHRVHTAFALVAARRRVAGRGALDDAGALLSARRSSKSPSTWRAGSRSTRPALTASKGARPRWSSRSTATFIRSWVFRWLASFAPCGGWDFRCRPRIPWLLNCGLGARTPWERPIFTYRDERRLFALISLIIVAALIALVQIGAQRAKTESPIAAVATSLFAFAESAVSATVGGVRGGAAAVVALPQLERDDARLRAQNTALSAENARLHELAAAYAAEAGVRAVGRALSRHRGARHRLPAGKRIAHGDDRPRIAMPASTATTACVAAERRRRTRRIGRSVFQYGRARHRLHQPHSGGRAPRTLVGHRARESRQRPLGIRAARRAAARRRRRRHRRRTFVSLGRADRNRYAQSSAATRRSIKRRS